MATLTTKSGAVTLLDWAKSIDPDGSVAKVAELLHQSNEILMDMPWVEGNLPTLPVAGRFYELRARLVISDQDIEESPVLSDVCVLKKE